MVRAFGSAFAAGGPNGFASRGHPMEKGGMMRIKPLVLGAVLVGALAIGVAAAGADQTFKSGLYQNQPYSCANGSQIDPSGQSFGTFQVINTHSYPSQLVQAHIAVDNMLPNRLYRVTVTEYGLYCIPAWPDNQPMYMPVGYNGHGSLDFTFWAHTLEKSAYVTIKSVQPFGIGMTVRGVALPINR
jgi:hypothetical protein